MGLDYASLETLIAHHPGWQLLRHEHAALAASLLQRAFADAGLRALPRATLVEALDDELFRLRRRSSAASIPTCAATMLDCWADPRTGWLREFYTPGSDEPHYELMPEAARALAWLGTLRRAGFAGTAARLLLLTDLIAQLRDEIETDPAKRIDALHARRDAIDAEIARVAAGEASTLDAAALKERFLQLARLSEELLLEFHAAEHELRASDARVRSHIEATEVFDATALDRLLSERRELTASDTARSLHAAWRSLLSVCRNDGLREALDAILAVPALGALAADERMRHIHYDWLHASERARRTLAELAAQLRAAVASHAWEERRSIDEIVRAIEAKAMDRNAPAIAVPVMPAMPSAPSAEARAAIVPAIALADEAQDDVAAFAQPPADAAWGSVDAAIDRADLVRRIERALQERAEVTLRELIDAHPLAHGLLELLAYFDLAQTELQARIDEAHPEAIAWDAAADDGTQVRKQAWLPRVVFVR